VVTGLSRTKKKVRYAKVDLGGGGNYIELSCLLRGAIGSRNGGVKHNIP